MHERQYTTQSIATYMDDSIEQNWTRATINEFNYLLKFISGGEIEFFSIDTMPKIYKEAETLLSNITHELSKEIMVEEEKFKIKRSTAEHNLKNLRDIILSIKEYYKNGGLSKDSHIEELKQYLPEKIEISLWEKIKNFFH